LILAGDVGGTKTALMLYERGGGPSAPIHEDTLSSREFASFEDAIRRFLAAAGSPVVTAACFGVPGPVIDGRCATTNLPWELDEAALARAIPAGHVKLLNDLEATGHGILRLPASQTLALQSGKPRPGHKAVVAAGTGLGEAVLIWDGACHRVIGSEGGHTDFAPRTDLEIDLLRYLRREFGHVSYERVLSGPGLFNIYRFLRETGHAPEPEWLAQRLRGGDPSPVIAEVGLADGHPLCSTALDVFIGIYGAEAANLALTVVAHGGVYIGGGIAPKLRARLANGSFITAFREKGRFADLLETIPVYLVMEPRTALLGAAHVAESLG
jgi:glucokinase